MIQDFSNYIKESEIRELSQRVINPKRIDTSLPELFKRNIRLGYKPFYIDSSYYLREIKLNKNWMPYKEGEAEEKVNWRGEVETKTNKTYYSNKSNPFGRIFFLNQTEYDQIEKLVDEVRNIREKSLKKIELLDDLVASKINELGK